jgi:xanthine/CO dehydrogenase XdhC/CoxF family maturation factor
MSDPLTEVRFWAQVMADSERTIVCSPENESRIKSWIDARNCGGILKVLVERYVPDDQIFVMDHNAIEASTRQMLAGPVRLWPLRDHRDGYKEH